MTTPRQELVSKLLPDCGQIANMGRDQQHAERHIPCLVVGESLCCGAEAPGLGYGVSAASFLNQLIGVTVGALHQATVPPVDAIHPSYPE